MYAARMRIREVGKGAGGRGVEEGVKLARPDNT